MHGGSQEFQTVMPYKLPDKVLFSLKLNYLLRLYNQHEMQQMEKSGLN